MSTPARAILDRFPGMEKEGWTEDSLNKRIREGLSDEKQRGHYLEQLRYSIPEYKDLRDDAVMMSVLGEDQRDRAASMSAIRGQMDEASRGSQIRSVLPMYKGSQRADETLNSLGDPSHNRRIFAQAFTPDELDTDKRVPRVTRTFKDWGEAKKIQAENPESEIFSDGVKVWIVDKERNTIAQGQDDFVSYDPFDVSMSAQSTLGRGGQRLLGAVTGAGDPLQQQGAAALRFLGGREQAPGLGFPEVGAEVGRDAGQLLHNAAPNRDILTPLANFTAGVLTPFAEQLASARRAGKQLKAGLQAVGGRIPTSEIENTVAEGDKAYEEGMAQAKKLEEGVPDIPKEAHEELSRDFGESVGRTFGAGAQMLGRTGGAEAIKAVGKPVVEELGQGVRTLMAEGLDPARLELSGWGVKPPNPAIPGGMADDPKLARLFHDAPAISAVESGLARDALEGARQQGKTASDIYSQGVAKSIGDGSDPIWADLHNAMNSADEMAKVRAKYGDAKVNSAMERLMSVRKTIQSQLEGGVSSAPKKSLLDPGPTPETDVQLNLPLFKQQPPQGGQIPLIRGTRTQKPPVQGETWTGRTFDDIRPGEMWKDAKERVFADEVATKSNMTAREKDLLRQQLDSADALTTTAQTARNEFIAREGPKMEVMRSLQKSFEKREIESEAFDRWYANAGSSDKAYSDFMFSRRIGNDIQGRLRADGKALLIIDNGEVPEIIAQSKDHRSVFVIPSTGSRDLDRSLNFKVVDRPTGQAIHQMTNLPSAAEAAAKTAKAMDDVLAASSASESLTRGNPGFDAFQRPSEIIRVVIDNPAATSDGSREMVGKLFRGELDKDLTDQIMRQGTIGYGRTAEMLKLQDKPQLLLGEKFIKDQGGLANKVSRGRRLVRDVLMTPGKLSSLGTDEATRRLFPGLPDGVRSEDAIRAWHTLSLIKSGMRPTSAIQQTNRLLVNFADKNALQEKLGPYTLFIKWQSAATKGALDAALKNPDKYRHLYDFMRAAETYDAQTGEGPISAKAKEPWQNFAGIPLVEIDGKPTTIKVPGPGTEVGDVAEMASNTIRKYIYGAPPAGPTILGMANPNIRGPVSALTGKDMATNRTWALANKGFGDAAYKMPDYGGGGLYGIADLQRKDPANFPPDALLGRNPELAATLEYAGAFGASEAPPWVLDSGRMALGRVSPTRLDPEEQDAFKKRKLAQYMLGARYAPFDPYMNSVTRTRQGFESVPPIPELAIGKQIKKGSLPEDDIGSPNDDLLRMYMERLYGRGNP